MKAVHSQCSAHHAKVWESASVIQFDLGTKAAENEGPSCMRKSRPHGSGRFTQADPFPKKTQAKVAGRAAKEKKCLRRDEVLERS